MRKYTSPNHAFNEWVGYETKQIEKSVRDDSAGLERSDLKAIVLELCQRVYDAENQVARLNFRKEERA